MVVRSFCRGDAEYLEALDNKCFDFGKEIEWFIQNGKSCRVAEVPENRDGPVGYYVCEVHSKISLCVLRLAVDTRYRRLGIGSALIDDIFSEGWQYSRVICPVDEENYGAQKFLQANQFSCIRILKQEQPIQYLFAKDIGV